jgi:tRNA (guanine37-N1)-methyltransferase
MWCGIVSIFPSMFSILKNYGITSYAYKNDILRLDFFNPKLYSKKNVYDKPYGGGKGVVMSYKPLKKAIYNAKLKKPQSIVIYVTPKGKLIDNNIISKLSKYKSIIFVSGRYEDIDNRIIKQQVDVELSIGDYIVSGGEIPTMMIIDSICRLLPYVIKNKDSTMIESFNNNLLDYQQYTRPKCIAQNNVPNVLIQGNHDEISKWRYTQRLGNTFIKRPDLLFNRKLSNIDKILLNEFIENKKN